MKTTSLALSLRFCQPLNEDFRPKKSRKDSSMTEKGNEKRKKESSLRICLEIFEKFRLVDSLYEREKSS